MMREVEHTTDLINKPLRSCPFQSISLNICIHQRIFPTTTLRKQYECIYFELKKEIREKVQLVRLRLGLGYYLSDFDIKVVIPKVSKA
ncbi:UNVERIFIED_CONTAM: hypothetical protein NCL1_57222 [Trichonephila clavipes]